MGYKVVINNVDNSTRLVTLKPGVYWKVDVESSYVPLPRASTSVELKDPTNALLLEFQGKHRGKDECWHALVDGQVILVWGSSFDNEVNKL